MSTVPTLHELDEAQAGESILFDSLARLVPEEVQTAYYRVLAHTRTLSPDDEMLRILEAMGTLALLTRHTPKDIADERERLQEMFEAEDIAVSWNALLRYASQQAKGRKKGAGRFALILDEFPYLVDQTPELPSILQAWWDREAVHSPLFIVLCGSQLSAMAALGQESAPLFGRFNAGIFHLNPLDYEDVAAFYADSPHYGIVEKLLMYGVFGGTPRYHALVDTSRPPAEEIVALLMQPRAILDSEVRFLLGSEQIRDPAPYNAILAAIAGGETKFNGIQQ